MSQHQLEWTVQPMRDHSVVTLRGDLDEQADLTELAALSGTVVFDLAGVTRVNSVGVCEWNRFVQRCTTVDRIILRRCSFAIVAQLNMHNVFQQRAEIESVLAPYVCESTGESRTSTIDVSELEDPKNPPLFPHKDGVWELDDLPERYFAFLLTAKGPG